jgi:hypothetical protein
MARHAFHRGNGDHIARLTEHDHRHEAICFADEIVIDFPSMARAVDRMRRGFLIDERLADDPTPLQLSHRQAREGTVVPLAVPLRCTCLRCRGRGETSGNLCPACDGDGTELRRQDVRVSVPPGVCHGDRFHFHLIAPDDATTRVELQILVA